MIPNKTMSLEDAYSSGFEAGLKAAAEYHKGRAKGWCRCATEAHLSIDKEMMEHNAVNHRHYAHHILNLKEKSSTYEEST